jgi:hypothetical protein
MIEQSERSRHLIEVSRRAMHCGHDAWAAFNLSDKVTVALVLNRADWLEEFGCTLAEAIAEARNGPSSFLGSPANFSTKGCDAARQPIQPTTRR